MVLLQPDYDVLYKTSQLVCKNSILKLLKHAELDQLKYFFAITGKSHYINILDSFESEIIEAIHYTIVDYITDASISAYYEGDIHQLLNNHTDYYEYYGYTKTEIHYDQAAQEVYDQIEDALYNDLQDHLDEFPSPFNTCCDLDDLITENFQITINDIESFLEEAPYDNYDEDFAYDLYKENHIHFERSNIIDEIFR